MASHFTSHKRPISSHKHHLIHLTLHTCNILLVLWYFTSSHMHISSISSYHIISYQHTIHLIFHIFLVFKRVLYTHFIILADDGCNTASATESSQTNRLLRVFHSCYSHYSEFKCPIARQ